MLSCLGKVLIVLSLCFQAYILLERQSIANQFNTKLLTILQKCSCLPDHISGYILFYARFVIVGFIASSVMMSVSKLWCLKLLPLLGMLILLYIDQSGFAKMPCIECACFWTKISQIGALIHLMAADCATKTIKKVQVQKIVGQGQDKPKNDCATKTIKKVQVQKIVGQGQDKPKNK